MENTRLVQTTSLGQMSQLCQYSHLWFAHVFLTVSWAPFEPDLLVHCVPVGAKNICLKIPPRTDLAMMQKQRKQECEQFIYVDIQV